jgi:putative membrane protein
MFRFFSDPDFFWGLLPLLGTLFWIALLVVLILALLRWLTASRTIPIIGYQPPPPYQPSAVEILRQRYARGDIDEATYQQMRERLEASTLPGQQQHF